MTKPLEITLTPEQREALGTRTLLAFNPDDIVGGVEGLTGVAYTMLERSVNGGVLRRVQVNAMPVSAVDTSTLTASATQRLRDVREKLSDLRRFGKDLLDTMNDYRTASSALEAAQLANPEEVCFPQAGKRLQEVQERWKALSSGYELVDLAACAALVDLREVAREAVQVTESTPIATSAEKRLREALYQLNMHAGKHPDVSAAIGDLEDLLRTSCLEGSYVLDEDETHALVQFVTFREVAAEQAVLRVCKRIEKLRAEGTTKASPPRDECADYEAVCTELGMMVKQEGFADQPAPISRVLAHLRGMRRGLDERQAVSEIFGRFLVELFPNLRAKGNGPDHAESIVRQARAIVAANKERAAAGLPSDEDFKAFLDRRLKVLADQLENDFLGARDAARAPVEEETLARMRAHPREQADSLRSSDLTGEGTNAVGKSGGAILAEAGLLDRSFGADAERVRFLGNVRSLLYTLLRDDVVPGRLEQLVQDMEKHPGPYAYSNEHLSAYALELARRVFAVARSSSELKAGQIRIKRRSVDPRATPIYVLLVHRPPNEFGEEPSWMCRYTNVRGESMSKADAENQFLVAESVLATCELVGTR